VTEHQMISTLAPMIHMNWLTNLCHADGYKPQMVKTTDIDWIREHRTDYLDLAEYTYDNLPKDWQSLYHSQAQAVLPKVLEVFGTIKPTADYK